MKKYLSILRISKFRKEDAVISRSSVNKLKEKKFSELWDCFYKYNIYPKHKIRADGRLEIGRPIGFFYRFLVENNIRYAPFVMISEKEFSHKKILENFNIFELKKLGDLFLSSCFQIKVILTVQNPLNKNIEEYVGYSKIDFLSNLDKQRFDTAKQEAINHSWSKIWYSPTVLRFDWYLLLIFWLEYEYKTLKLNLQNYRIEYYLGYEK